MKLEDGTKLDFSDVLIKPKRSELSSRNDVKLERTFVFKNSKRSWTGIPIVVSNMDTTGTVDMARALEKFKMIVCLHKFHKVEDIPSDLNPEYYAVTTGIREGDLENLDIIVKERNPHFICIDVPNGYSVSFIKKVKEIRVKYPDITLIGGNVVTNEMVGELTVNGGLDIVKIGIGSGATCITRTKTGVGYPQLSAIFECSEAAHSVDSCIMSDGGIQVAGDFAKAFGAGADFIMCGGIFAGHDESGGEVIEEDGKKFCTFYGMSSSHAMNKYYGGVADYRSSEGKVVKIPYRGPVENTVKDILGGIRSSMTYIGAKKLIEIPERTTFIKVNNQVNNIFK